MASNLKVRIAILEFSFGQGFYEASSSAEADKSLVNDRAVIHSGREDGAFIIDYPSPYG